MLLSLHLFFAAQNNFAEFGGAVYMHLYNINSDGHYIPSAPASAVDPQDSVSGGIIYRCTLSMARVDINENYGQTSAGVYFRCGPEAAAAGLACMIAHEGSLV